MKLLISKHNLKNKESDYNISSNKKVILYFFAEGGTLLPEVEVTAPKPRRYLELTTYYPGHPKYRFTGHSELNPILPIVVNSKGNSVFYNLNRTLQGISKGFNNKGYNLLTNNCSDATKECLEYSLNKKFFPLLFTTPGDVKDFAVEKLKGKPLYVNTKKFNYLNNYYDKTKDKFMNTFESITYIPVNRKLYYKVLDFIDKGSKNNEFNKGGIITKIN